MRIKGPSYLLRDAKEEWGEFRVPSIEALIFIGKVTRATEARPASGGPWGLITTIPELAALFDSPQTEGSTKGRESAARKSTPSEALLTPKTTSQQGGTPPLAAPPTAPPPVRPIFPTSSPQPIPVPVPVPESAPPAAPPPAAPPGATYKVICSDTTMLGPLPLPLLLAQIWDGRVGPADLVSRDSGTWAAAEQFAELTPAFARAGVAIEPTPAPGERTERTQPPPGLIPDAILEDEVGEALLSPLAVATGPAVALPPPPGVGRGSRPPGEVPRRSSSPLGSQRSTPPPVVLPVPGIAAAGDRRVEPPPAAPPAELRPPVTVSPLVTPPPAEVVDEAPTEVMSRKQIAEVVHGKARPVPLAGGEQATFDGRLEASPLVKVLGRVLRARGTGRLIFDGPYRLTLRCRDGAVVGAQREPPASETEQLVTTLLGIPEETLELAQGREGQLVDFLAASGAIDGTTATSLRSLQAFEEVLGLFGWRTGAYAFLEEAVDAAPDFLVHPLDLVRAGLLVGFSADEMEAAVRGWAKAEMAPGPAGVLSPGVLPLTSEEQRILGLVTVGRTFGEIVAEAEEVLHLARPLVLSTLYTAHHLGLVTLNAARSHSSAHVVASAIFDPTLPPDVLLRTVQEADFFNLLGVPRSEEIGDVDAALQRTRAHVRAITSDPKQAERLLARVERAHKVLADPATRQLYLLGGEQALPPLPAERSNGRASDSGIRISTPSPLRAAVDAARADGSGLELSRGRIGTPLPGPLSTVEDLAAQSCERARKHLEAKQYADAVMALRQSVKVAPTVGIYQALLAWGILQDSRQTPQDLKVALNSLEQACSLALDDAECHYYLGQVHYKMASQRKARQAFSRALQLAPDFALVREALQKMESDAKTVSGTEPWRLVVALALYVVVAGGFFYLANFLGHDPDAAIDGFGAQEYYYHPDNWFFYLRRGGLLLFGVLGVLYLFPREKSRHLVAFAALGLLYGVLFGYLSYSLYGVHWPKDEVPPMSAVALLVVLHAFADEFFFRGVIARAILPRFAELLPGALVASLLYGLYHLSYVGYWWGLHYFDPGMLIGSMPVQVISISLTMGLPLTLLYGKSKSLVPGIIAQIAFGWLFLLLSISRTQGL